MNNRQIVCAPFNAAKHKTQNTKRDYMGIAIYVKSSHARWIARMREKNCLVENHSKLIIKLLFWQKIAIKKEKEDF